MSASIRDRRTVAAELPGESAFGHGEEPFVNFAGQAGYVHNMSIYRAHSGALVWATGTMDWSWALAPGGSSDGAHVNVRPSLQRLTENVLRRMLHGRRAPRH